MYARKHTKPGDVITKTKDFIKYEYGLKIAEQFPALKNYHDKYFFIALYILVQQPKLYKKILDMEDMDAYPLTWDVSDIYYLDDGVFKYNVEEKKKRLTDEYNLAIKDKLGYDVDLDEYIVFRCIITKYAINCYCNGQNGCYFTLAWVKMKIQTTSSPFRYEILNDELCLVASCNVPAGTELYRQKIAYDDMNMINYGVYPKDDNPSTLAVILKLNIKNAKISLKYGTYQYHLTKYYSHPILDGTRELMSALRIYIATNKRDNIPKFEMAGSSLDIAPETLKEELDVLFYMYNILHPEYIKRKQYSTQIIRNKHIVGYLTRSLDLLYFWLTRCSEIATIIDRHVKKENTQTLEKDLNTMDRCKYSDDYIYDLLRLC